MNEKEDIYVMKTVMNETEDICETKTIISFLMKHIVTVTRQRPSPRTGTNTSDRPLRAIKFWAVQEGHVGGALG